MGIFIQGALIGIIATFVIDIWAVFVKRILQLPTANWALVGRWFGYLPRGKFIHRPIADSAAIPHELTIGWFAHYVTGLFYGIAYLGIVQGILSRSPSMISALTFGLLTLFAPWLILQPGMGAGVFASRTPRPGIMRLVNLSMHAIFGVSLYVAWLLISLYFVQPIVR